MIRVKTSLDHKKIRRLIWLVLTVSVLLGYSLQSVAGSAYYSIAMQAYGTVSSPPVFLEAGNVSGASTIYTNKTSAKVNVTAPIWLSGWNKRVKITIDHNDVSSVLSNFSVLIYLSNSSGRNTNNVTFVFDEVGSNSKKIAVTTSSGTNQCYVEVDKWDATNKKAWLWVKVPSVSNTTDTDLYLYYDNSHADNTDYVGDTGSTPAQNVWDANYKFVGHMRDNPDTSHIKDSTSNNNNGTKRGADEPAVTTSGKIDDAQNFDGSNDYINCGTGIPDTTYHTITAWVNLDLATGGTYYCCVDVDSTSSPYNGLALTFRKSDGAIGRYVNGWRFSSTNKVTTGVWAFVAIRGYKSSSGYVEIRKDASSWENIFNASTTNYLVVDSGTEFDIGRWASPNYYTGGIVDEVRISNTLRDNASITASYESERDHLVAYGNEEVGGSNYDYVLKVVNQVADNWTVNLKVYDNSSLSRILSLNITFHDGTLSNQIAVSSGSLVKSEGEPYNLAGNATVYISMSSLKATTTGTSYLYVYLKILMPNTSTYILYVITFEIT